MDRVIERKRGIKRKHIPYIIGATLFVILLLWVIFGNHASTVKVNREMVTISDVTRGEFKDYIRINGMVVPVQVVRISPEEGGIVMEKVAEEGQSLKKGDVIVRLSNSNLDLQILNAEAELAEKQNMLRNTQVAMQQDKLSNETENASLDVDVKRKHRAFQQNERLYSEKLISRETYLQSKEDYELAKKKQGLVSERLKQDALYRKVQMEQMEDNLDNMRKNVILVRERKGKLEVRSNIDGELGLLDVELGQSISAGQTIGQINDLSSFKVEAMVDEIYIDRVRVGLTATATIRLPQGKEREYTFIIRKVYPEVRNGKFKVDMKLDRSVAGQDDWNDARVGATVYLNLELGKPEQTVLIPRSSFFQTTGGNWIFVLDKDGSKAYRRNIRIGRQNPLYYEVIEGLEPGERVITSSYDSFKDNEIIKF